MDKVFVVQFIAGHRTRKILGVFDSQEAAQSRYPDIPDDLFEDDGIRGKGYNVICTDVLSLDNMYQFSKNAKPRKLLHIKRLVSNIENALNNHTESYGEVMYDFETMIDTIGKNSKQIINIIDMMLEPIEGE